MEESILSLLDGPGERQDMIAPARVDCMPPVIQDTQRKQGILSRHCEVSGSSHLLGDAVKDLVVMRNSVLVNLALLRLNPVPFCTAQNTVTPKLLCQAQGSTIHTGCTPLLRHMPGTKGKWVLHQVKAETLSP